MTYRLPSSWDKAAYVRRGFDSIAKHYDRFNDLITQGQHRRWKSTLVHRLELTPGARVLDLCCGTGDLAQRAANRLLQFSSPPPAAEAPQAGVVAADFSLEMLRIAQRRLTHGTGARGDGSPRMLITTADALTLPFADSSFQAVTIGYGLRNVADRTQCLSEVLRVLAPGGTLASLDVGKVRWAVLAPFVRFYLYHVVPWIGHRIGGGGDMYTYLPHSSEAYAHQDKILVELHDAGFEQLELIEYLWGTSVIHLARKPGQLTSSR